MKVGDVDYLAPGGPRVVVEIEGAHEYLLRRAEQGTRTYHSGSGSMEKCALYDTSRPHAAKEVTK